MPDVPEPTPPAEAQEVEQQGVVAAGVESPRHDGVAVSDSVAAFLDGYRFGGGDPAWEEHLVDVIECESGWNVDPPGIHYGLAQFAPGTWAAARCSPEADYREPFQQGCAVARWMSMIAPNYGTTAGWPHCWWE